MATACGGLGITVERAGASEAGGGRRTEPGARLPWLDVCAVLPGGRRAAAEVWPQHLAVGCAGVPPASDSVPCAMGAAAPPPSGELPVRGR